MNNRSRVLILLVLGGAVAGWGCALLSGNEPPPPYEQQDQGYAGLLRRFDALAAAQQATPDRGTLQQLYDFLRQAETLPHNGARSNAPLFKRHEKLANWGYADSQYWLGNYLDPCVHEALGRERQQFPQLADSARAWYSKAAAQNQPEAVAALARLDHCTVPQQ